MSRVNNARYIGKSAVLGSGDLHFCGGEEAPFWKWGASWDKREKHAPC